MRFVLNKNIDGILEVRDESDREGLRIVIDLKKNCKCSKYSQLFL